MKFFKVLLVVVFLAFVTGFAATEESEPMDAEVNLKEEVNEQKTEAWKEGVYSCCLKHPCDQCIVNMGACPCGENIVNGDPVCHECKGGYYAGDGKFEDIDPDDIAVFPRGEM